MKKYAMLPLMLLCTVFSLGATCFINVPPPYQDGGTDTSPPADDGGIWTVVDAPSQCTWPCTGHVDDSSLQ